MDDDGDQFKFDAAFSFAGEDRAYVEQFVARVKEAKITCFYDEDHMVDMWGANLVEFFDKVYRLDSRFAVLFISSHYIEKDWTRHERRSALSRALVEDSAYVLPIRLDDSLLPGLPPTVGYLDARVYGRDAIADMLVQKVQVSKKGARPGSIAHVPTNEAEMQVMEKERPGGWEYMLFSGALRLSLRELEERYLDHDIGYADSAGITLDEGQEADWLARQYAEIGRVLATGEAVLSAQAQERAFGAPGEPGDPVRIRHLARRVTAVYEGLLKWAASLRGVAAADEARPLIEATAALVNGPIEQYRAFVADAVSATSRIPAALASGEHLRIDLTMRFTMREEDSAALDAANTAYLQQRAES